MPAALRAVVPLLAAVFILIAGNGIISTLVPLRATLEGFSQADIGFIGSCYFGGMLAGAGGQASASASPEAQPPTAGGLGLGVGSVTQRQR